MAEAKTETVIFHGKVCLDPLPRVSVGKTRIGLGKSMKYLGVIVDSRWSFSDHFQYVNEKATKVMRALGRLMPNLRGPDKSKRQLYTNVVQSIVLYGVPVWCDALVLSKSKQRVFNRIQRILTIRVSATCRTVSCVAASLLARIPLFFMLAMCRRRVYEQVDARKWRDWTTQEAKEIKLAETLLLERQWKIYLNNPALYGKHTLEVINPNFEEWIARSHGRLGYHLTQFLTDSFGSFLHKIKKREDASYFHCDALSVDHILRECPAWWVERIQLRIKFKMADGEPLTLEYVVRKILESQDYWSFFVRFFAASVIRAKKEEERRRRRELSRSLSPV